VVSGLRLGQETSHPTLPWRRAWDGSMGLTQVKPCDHGLRYEEVGCSLVATLLNVVLALLPIA
jgi:hypothetical protein